MKEDSLFFNRETGAFVHRFTPINVYVYDHRPFPHSSMNFLAKILLLSDRKAFDGDYLFNLSTPVNADFFLFPCDLNYYERREEQVYDLLTYFRGNEERHLFVDHRDQAEISLSDACVYLKVSLYKDQVTDRVICIPYLEMVDNLFWYFQKPPAIKYMLSFIGEWTAFRESVLSSLEGLSKGLGLQIYFRLRRDFYHKGYLQFSDCGASPEELSRERNLKQLYRDEFIEVMQQSRFALAPRGYALNSFRFFEALSLGVPPILISNRCALPFENLIPYEKICFIIDSEKEDIVPRVRAIIQMVNPDQNTEIGRLGRLYYDSYLSCKNFLFLLYEALRKLL